jgi:diketogulonate reductase-like aldo/keto reductase
MLSVVVSLVVSLYYVYWNVHCLTYLLYWLIYTHSNKTRWIPDTIPLIKPNKSKVIQSSSQANLRDVILNCLKCGLNHFETARFYGSSEVQFVTALAGLVEDGTVKREEFIFQTKLFPNEKREDFLKQWEASW